MNGRCLLLIPKAYEDRGKSEPTGTTRYRLSQAISGLSKVFMNRAQDRNTKNIPSTLKDTPAISLDVILSFRNSIARGTRNSGDVEDKTEV